MCIVWLEGVINQRTSPGYDLSMRRAKLTSIGWHASPKSARCPFEWTEAVVSAIIVVGPQLEKAKGRQLVWSWILGSKVPYLVMVFGLPKSRQWSKSRDRHFHGMCSSLSETQPTSLIL